MPHTNKIKGYRQVHTWVSGKLGNPKYCTNCKFISDNSRQFHWANISGEYKRDLNDWKRLCVRCHKAFDGHEGLLFKNYCKNNHHLTLDNLYKHNYTIECLKCKREASRLWWAKKRQLKEATK